MTPLNKLKERIEMSVLRDGFKAEHFLSDDDLNKGIRDIFPEWNEIITRLAKHHADQANALLQAELKEAVRVYSEERVIRDASRGERRTFSSWRKRESKATHTALLINPEPMKEGE